MSVPTLQQASNDLFLAVSRLAQSPEVDWGSPVFAPVALAHANLHDALTGARKHIGWMVRGVDGQRAMLSDEQIDAANGAWVREFKLYAD
jgi:hypothetical protein